METNAKKIRNSVFRSALLTVIMAFAVSPNCAVGQDGGNAKREQGTGDPHYLQSALDSLVSMEITALKENDAALADALGALSCAIKGNRLNELHEFVAPAILELAPLTKKAVEQTMKQLAQTGTANTPTQARPYGVSMIEILDGLSAEALAHNNLPLLLCLGAISASITTDKVNKLADAVKPFAAAEPELWNAEIERIRGALQRKQAITTDDGTELATGRWVNRNAWNRLDGELSVAMRDATRS